ASARGGGRTAQPASYRGGQRRHLAIPDHPGTAPAIPLVPPGREPGPAESPCPVVSGADPRVLHAVDRRLGPVAAVGGPDARRTPPAAGRGARLLRYLLGVRRPVGR